MGISLAPVSGGNANMRLYFDYSAGSGSFSISGFQGCRIDSYTSQATNATIHINVGGQVQSFPSRWVEFRKNSNWYAFTPTSAYFSGLNGNTSITISFSNVVVSNNIHNAVFSTTINAGTLAHTMTNAAGTRTLNTLEASWSTNMAVNAIQCSVNGGAWTNPNTGATPANTTSGSVSITGRTPNTTYTLRLRSRGTASGLWIEASSTLSITTLAIGSMSASPNFDLGSNASVTTVTPSTTSTAYNLSLLVGGTQILIRNGVGNAGAKTVTFTRAELDTLYRRMVNNANLAITWRLATVYGGSTWNSDRAATIVMSGNQPTIQSNVNDVWRRGYVWTKVNDVWRRGLLWIRDDGSWKRAI